MTDAILVEGLVKHFGAVKAVDGIDLRVAPGLRVRPARAQRRRQDHRGPGPHHHPRSPTPAGPRCSGIDVAEDPQGIRERIGLAGQYAAVDENLTGRENLRHDRQADPPRRRSSCASGPTSCSSASGCRSRRPHPQDLLRGHAPPPRPRRRPRAPPAGAVPRRADHRARPRQPQGPVGRHRRARRRGHDRAAHDAVPRGGRPARRAARRDRPGPRDRRGHARRAEGPPRGDDDRPRLRRPRCRHQRRHRPAALPGGHRGRRRHARRRVPARAVRRRRAPHGRWSCCGRSTPTA